MEMASDNVLFAQGNVTVSQTRFVVSGDTYVMSNISSCRTRYTEEVDDGMKGLLWLAVVASLAVGVVLAIAVHLALGGLIAIAGMVAAFVFIKPKYQFHHLYIGTNSGEIEAISSRDEDYINQIERAVNDAIVARG